MEPFKMSGIADQLDTGTFRTPSLASLKETVLSGDPACVCDPELFTGPTDIELEEEPALEQAARLDAARDICADCPVRVACLAYALRVRPETGMWSGLTAAEIKFVAAAARRPVTKPPARTVLREVA